MKACLFVTSVIFLSISAYASVNTEKSGVEITDVQILERGMCKATFVERKKIGEGDKLDTYKDFEFINTSTRVPAKKGNRFGIRFVIRGKPDGKEIRLRIRRLHPPMKNPIKKKVVTVSEYTKTVKLNTPRLIGYGFDEEWELVPGNHVFEIYYKEQKLLEETFTVYIP